MKVILLEKVKNLGELGSIVSVKPGYARNYLLPFGAAEVANEQSIARFEARRAELERRATEQLQHAEGRAASLRQTRVEIKARAGDEGKLFGSIGTHEIARAISEKGTEVARHEIRLPTGPIRLIGDYEITLQLHADVSVVVQVSVVADVN